MILLKNIVLLNLLVLSNLTASELLPITSEKVTSISVLPNKEHGASTYTLKIYDNDEMEKPTIKLTHPLSGKITDVEMTDIDKDQKNELVISSTHETNAGNMHQDIYEFIEDGIIGSIQTFFLKLFHLYNR